MTMIDTNNIDALTGAAVYGTDGDKIGTVGQVYIDTDTQAPFWVTIKTGLFGTGESFAPLENATFDGDDLRVPFEKALVKDAPRISDDGSLSEDEEDALYAYYVNGGSANVGVSDAPGQDTRADREVGYDTSGPTTDDAMTRSVEQLNVGTEKVESSRARLRKHVVTEMQTVTVPVSHEEVSLTREPITEANVGRATAGPDLSDEEHEVVLTEERAVVNKETVPVERVALGTETVTEQQLVTEQVGHEEIELVNPTTGAEADNRR